MTETDGAVSGLPAQQEQEQEQEQGQDSRLRRLKKPRLPKFRRRSRILRGRCKSCKHKPSTGLSVLKLCGPCEDQLDSGQYRRRGRPNKLNMA